MTRLQERGFTKEPAGAFVAVAQEVDLSTFVTKADLEIALANRTITIIKWMTGMLLAQGALIVALLQYLK